MAIKILHPELMSNAQIAQRFLNEGLAASILQSEHIIKVHDCHQDVPTGIWWIAMERLHGKSLARYLASQQRPLLFEKTIQIACQIAEALDEAHAHGIIHRDIKPDNVFLIDRDGNSEFVKVLDFGIAKLRKEDSGLVTQTNAVLGTQPYMSPQQLRGLPIDNRADVYALTVVLYLMLSNGYHPFQFSETLQDFYHLSSAELCLRQMNQTPIDVRHWTPDVPEAVAKVLESGLHRDPDRRPNSAGDLVVELARVGGALDVVGRYSKLLTPNAARRSIQVPVPEAPVTKPPTVRLQRGATGGPSTVTDVPTTLGSVASQAIVAPGGRGFVVKIGVVAAALAVGAIVFTAVWFAPNRNQATRDPGAAKTTDAGTTLATGTVPDAAVVVPTVDAEPAAVAPPDAAIAAITNDAVPPADAAVATAPVAAAPRDEKPVASAAKGWIVVSVTAPDANIYIDGKLVGQAAIRYKATVGPHTVTLESGAQRETIKVNVKANKPTVVQRQW